MKANMTQRQVNSLKPKSKPYWVTDEGCQNLRLKVGMSGKKAWYFNYRAENGKWNSEKLGDADVMNVAQAREAATNFKSDLLRGNFPGKTEPAKLTLGKLIEVYYAPFVAAYKKSGVETLSILRAQYEQFYSRPVAELTVSDMENWRLSRKKDGVKSASLNRYRGAILSMLNWAVENNYIDDNPLRRFKCLKEYDSDPIIRYLATEERSRLMEALDGREKRLRGSSPSTSGFADHLKPIVIVSLNTAIRRKGLLSLTWGDIDFNTGTITVKANSAKNSRTQQVPMNDEVANTLKAWRDQSADISRDAYVFPSPKGGMMHDCRSAWEKVLKDANIDNFRWHDMRHDVATQLRKKGAPIDIVSKVLGHADLRMTQRYAHIGQDEVRLAVESLSEVSR
jgi:integrase